jgi:dUTP pyrophosphatase
MLTLLLDGKKKNFYKEGDVVIQVSSGDEYTIEKVLGKEGKILTTTGIFLDLTPDLKANEETYRNRKVIDKRIKKRFGKELDVKVKMYNSDMPKFNKIDIGDWIDVRVNEVGISTNDKASIDIMQKNHIVDEWDNNKIKFKKGDAVLFRLGFAMALPNGFEAELKPRSGTFKNYGLLLTNSVGCIDNSYCGNNDEWQMMFYATRDGEVELFDRVGQFRINKKMSKLNIEYVDDLGNKDRGGYSSTGVK